MLSNESVAESVDSVGLYFVNTADESKTVRLAPPQICRNTSSLLEEIVPQLEKETYRIRVATCFTGAAGARKTVREHAFGKSVTVV
ncbi:MAG: DUF4469 domain-containing protein [Treponema sp.]|nr:DUF4469 domain-containing protein [Treponema sp.]